LLSPFGAVESCEFISDVIVGAWAVARPQSNRGHCAWLQVWWVSWWPELLSRISAH